MTENAWKSQLRLKLEGLVDDCVIAGARQQDVFDEVVKQVESLRASLEQDPDPADDGAVIEELSSDWPSATGEFLSANRRI